MSEVEGVPSFSYLGNTIGLCAGKANNACKDKFMAIKTDMSKAYDRVEWIFIQQLLSKMGFDHHWIRLMMECISSVQYIVLLNGQPKENIIPQRGALSGGSSFSLSIYYVHGSAGSEY